MNIAKYKLEYINVAVAFENKIRGIKLLRQVFCISLKESKDAIETADSSSS